MEIQEIQLSKIRPSQFQTRLAFDVDDLAASIEAQGVLEPVIVRPRTKTTYELVAGERRTRAAKQAGLEAVPAIVRELTDADALEVTVTENLQRDDLHPLEEAAGTDLLSPYEALRSDLPRRDAQQRHWPRCVQPPRGRGEVDLL